MSIQHSKDGEKDGNNGNGVADDDGRQQGREL